MRTLLAVIVSLCLATPAYAKGGAKKASLAKTATVSLADAVSKASAKGKPFEAELKKKHGKVVWELEVLDDAGKTMEVDVDAMSGDIIDSERKR